MNLNILNLKIITLDKLMTTYSITKTNKLIDLNGDKTNFVCSFECRSENGEDFYTSVVDQTTLDNEEDGIHYSKSINGVASNTFTSNNNIYQNHFLVLKADEPCEVLVNINVKELPKKLPSEDEIRKLEMIKQQVDEEYNMPEPPPEVVVEEKKYNWMRIFLFSLVAIGVVSGIYYLYNKRSTKPTPEIDIETKIDDLLRLSDSSNDVMDIKPVDTESLLSRSSPPPVKISPPPKLSSPSPIRQSPIIDYDVVQSPIQSPVRSASTYESPENSISKKIHEKLMEKLKKASIAY
jgi:hypothetical protein